MKILLCNVSDIGDHDFQTYVKEIIYDLPHRYVTTAMHQA